MKTKPRFAIYLVAIALLVIGIVAVRYWQDRQDDRETAEIYCAGEVGYANRYTAEFERCVDDSVGLFR